MWSRKGRRLIGSHWTLAEFISGFYLEADYIILDSV